MLRDYANNPGAAGTLRAGNSTAELPVAYTVVHPGLNGQFEGNNVVGVGGSWRFDLPGRVQDESFDDIGVAVGPADLSARLGCVARLGASQAALQVAFAQYDTARVMQEYWSLRVFDITTSVDGVSGARTGIALSSAGLAIAITSSVLGIASAANTEGLTIPLVVFTAISVASAIVDEALAIADLVSAEQALVDSQAKLAATGDYAGTAYNTLADALARWVALDTKGLNP